MIIYPYQISIPKVKILSKENCILKWREMSKNVFILILLLIIVFKALAFSYLFSLFFK